MEDYLCPICHENNNDTYTLPECNHKFCTECIMHWFRQGHSRCPLCNNPGGHVQQEQNQGFDLYISSHYGMNQKIKFLRKYAQRRNADELLKKYVKELREQEKKEKEIRKEMNDFKKNYTGTYKELMKKMSTFINKDRRIRSKIREIKRQMCSFPIEQITIVNRVNVENN
tara:strand:+ start:3309 stop:3818 length:510 start_codon:yes stop_codon:yes gene_type:complete